MSTPEDYYGDDDEDDVGEAEEGEGGEQAAAAGPANTGFRNWMAGRRGWVVIIALTVLQGMFAVILLVMRSDARPVARVSTHAEQDLAIEMLGHEVKIADIFQSIPVRGGKHVSIGMEIVLVLGQLPEERIEGVDRPTPDEMAQFISAIQAMEPRIRSRLNSLLQATPPDHYGRVEVFKTIKDDIQKMVNDSLEGLDFGKTVRRDIGKRRVTEVLLPVFLRQTS